LKEFRASGVFIDMTITILYHSGVRPRWTTSHHTRRAGISRLLILAGLTAVVACSSSEPGPTTPGGSGPGGSDPDNPGTIAAEVTVRDNFFQAASVTVSRGATGATVRWTWAGSTLHNVTFDAGAPHSPSRSSGTFSRTFSNTGEFTYFCSIHGRSVMSGVVIVE
jgi:plastocyanin